MNAAIYARVSTLHHDQNPDIQIQELRRYCNARSFTVTDEIIDHGYSGGTDNRPGLKRLLILARSRKVDIIIVTKLDRMFRSLKHLVALLDELQSLGVQFIATKDSIDWTTPAGRLFTQILASLAEFEKELIRERTIAGLNHARSKGKRLGRPKKRDDLEIIRLRRSGLTYFEIQQQLKVSKGSVCRALQITPKSCKKVDRKTK